MRHKVKDYGAWEAVFNGADDLHKRAGVRHAQVFRSADNPNEVIVLTEFENIAKARAFAQLGELKQAMEKGGVVGAPDVVFLEMATHRSWT